MRIAQIAPIIESVPPVKYGGTERVISSLTEQLVKRGHEVTLFASGDSKTSAKLFSVYHVALRKANIENMYGHNIWSLLNVGLAYQLQGQFDIIHDHNSQNNPVSLPLANIAEVPVVMTLHGPLTHGLSKTFEFYRKPSLVTISRQQQVPSPDLNYVGNVYHGLSMENYSFSREHDGYLLFVGRVRIENGVEVKGLHHAIDIAELTKLPLIIAAKVDTSLSEDVSYFNQVIKPRLSNKVKWVGEVDENTRNKLMSRALCMLHPVNFAEPFGLTLIEAMACGCPVVAFDKGSIPEVILDQKTGFVVKDTFGAVEAIKIINKIDRRFCRTYSLSNFSSERMAQDYEAIYNRIVKKKVFKRIPKKYDYPNTNVNISMNILKKAIESVKQLY